MAAAQPTGGFNTPARVPLGVLAALVATQVALHASMAGLRLAVPLLVLRLGPGPWGSPAAAAGLLVGLFALAPVLIALPAGRWVDRRGYPRPMRWSGLMVSLAGGVALAAAGLCTGFGLPGSGPGNLAARVPVPGLGEWVLPVLLGITATLAGTGSNIGLIATQRTAGDLVRRLSADGATDAAELRRVFSALGLAPALSNALGPLLVGVIIDSSGFATAFGAMALMPLAALPGAARVGSAAAAPPAGTRPGDPFAKEETAGRAAGPRSRRSSLALLTLPGMGTLLLLNWFMSSSWDLHAFLVPLLGHERGISASAIGTVLGLFAFAVAAVRVAIPLVAHRWTERQVLSGATLLAAAVFLVYPWAGTAPAMAACAAVLGLALGAVQPMIMTTLHHLAPPERQGEVIALRSSVINLSSTLLPMGFGLLGAALGPAVLFRAMAGALLLGALPLALAVGTPPDGQAAVGPGAGG